MNLKLSHVLGQACYLECHQCLNSTMDRAREILAKITENNYGLIITDRQLLGRGRQGRQWQSPESGYFATYVFKSKINADKLVSFPLVAALSLADTLQSYGCQLKIKWPNDLLTTDHKKISGILVELVTRDQENYLLVGIGVNLKGEPLNSASIYSLQKVEISPQELAQKLSPLILEYFKLFEKDGFSNFRTEIENRAWKLGEELKIDLGDRIVSGIYSGLSPNGALILEQENQKLEILSGHVIVE